ncbi:HAD family phosphatase [Cryobacterium sp. PAMC25264]|uniref:HAD family hydrolase n=1 Tax=Cryobacterium sp. PAMC25264 TaxID=2861288 RepID=UPI00210839D7|nr:HAD family hydrolase [Cryobacterium sp. PAMC25264]
MTSNATHSAPPAAVLWDMDGTLVDTEPYWMRAEHELVESFGGVWTHSDAMLLVGSGLLGSAAILQNRGVNLSAEAIVDVLTTRVQEQLASAGIPWRPGAHELLSDLHGAGVPMALVTMSEQRMARQIAGIVGFDAFTTIVSGDMVQQSKPHPEAYLTAAAVLGVDAAHCVAIEDSIPGVASAVASGAVVIGVPHMVPLEHSEHYTLWETLAGSSVTSVTALYRSRRSTLLSSTTYIEDATPA